MAAARWMLLLQWTNVQKKLIFGSCEEGEKRERIKGKMGKSLWHAIKMSKVFYCSC
jgi:hypothetical protein